MVRKAAVQMMDCGFFVEKVDFCLLNRREQVIITKVSAMIDLLCRWSR